MIKVIFIHGNGGGTAHDQWFPYIKKELEKLGLQVIARDFPDAQLAREKIWLPFINKLGADEDTILIGHSSGAIAALRFAQKNKILGSILVGVNYTDLGDETEKKSGYYNHPWNWSAIKENQKWVVIFASQDDPYIPISEPRFIQKQLNCEYHEHLDQGHFGYPKDKKVFPEIVQVIRNKLQV